MISPINSIIEEISSSLFFSSTVMQTPLPGQPIASGYSDHTVLAIFFLNALLLPLILLGAARLWARFFGRVHPDARQREAFECGIPSEGAQNIRFKAQYYHYGIVFLIFDVELAFLLPFAVAFLNLPAGAFPAMVLFILLLAEGLVWAWNKGILQWK